MQIRPFFAAVLFAACAAATVHAEPLFTDPFDYPIGILTGDGPPAGAPAGQTGWTGVSGSVLVTMGSLDYGSFVSTGNKVFTNGRGTFLGDNSGASLAHAGGTGGGTVWAGVFVTQASGAANPGGYAMLGFSSGTKIGMLFNTNTYGIDNNTGNTADRADTGVAVSGTVTWLVAKLDFDAGVQYLFVNPPADGEPQIANANAVLPMTAAFQAAGFDGVTLAAGSNLVNFAFDEVRLGTTFADTVPPISTVATVNVKAGGDRTVVAGGAKGKLIFSRLGGDFSADLTVNYKAVGTARNGVDYTGSDGQPLSGQVVIPAGQASVKIKIKSPASAEISGKEKIKIKLRASTDNSYNLGSTPKTALTLSEG